MRTVRPITVETGVLPRTHGSALFTRGETQALVTTTLGTGRDAQIIDALSGERKEPFMLHYNFPPFSVNEVSMQLAPKRREIGHGNLARRGISAVMPDMTTFPYVIRVVSEILESNGSSSMASVCGTSLALMDAGVPVKAPVAGVAMGLVLEGDKYQVLTDILGDEDHLGDMDFKVAGTADGVTALQMDIKIEGITKEIMKVALDQAREARLHILGEMAKVLSKPRETMSEWAPTIITMKIDPGEDPRSHRQGRRRDPGNHGRDGHDHRHRERRHGEDRLGDRHGRPRGAAAHRAHHLGRRGGARLRGQGGPAHGLRRLRADPARQGRPGAHLADLRRARGARQRQAEGRRPDSRQGARGRSPGPRAALDAQRRRLRRSRGCAAIAARRLVHNGVMARATPLTDLIRRAQGGDEAALGLVFDATYDELRRLAHARLSKGGRGTLLDTTSLVHESYLRLANAGQLRIGDRQHFLRYAGHAMRSVIVDYVRERMAERRGGDAPHVTLNSQIGDDSGAGETEILRVHEALDELAQFDARMVQVVEMRYSPA